MAGRRRIYGRIRAGSGNGGGLRKHLRRRGKKPDRRGGRHSGRGHIPGRVDISGRPAGVEAKERTGDREADTVIGKAHGGAVVSLVDRASKQPLPRRVDRRKADVVGKAMVDMPGSSGAPVHTVTADNGKGFGGGGGAGGGLFLRPPVPLLGARAERAHERTSAPVSPEGHGPAQGDGQGGAGHPERASAQVPRLPHAGGGAAAGPASLSRPFRRLTGKGENQPGAGACTAAGAGLRSGSTGLSPYGTPHRVVWGRNPPPIGPFRGVPTHGLRPSLRKRSAKGRCRTSDWKWGIENRRNRRL